MKADLIVLHKCYECDFEGEVKSINRKVVCPICKVSNDIWLEGETPPLNHR